MSTLARLGRFAAEASEERCGVCAAPLPDPHTHLVETGSGKLLCACAGCAGVFGHDSGRFRRLRDRVVRLGDGASSDGALQALGIPVSIGFLQRRSRAGSVVAVYPSPLGPVESEVDGAAWEGLLRDHPELRSLEEDVEALLVRPGERYIAPLDECYALIGLLRREWRGFTGGDAVREAVDRFFERLRGRAEEGR
jgi:hypothetical protein